MPVEFGKYQLMKRVASGGMGQVFLARLRGSKGFEKVLVIKRILPNLAEDEEFLSMFVDEARIAARLNHPNIGQIYELGEVDGSHYLAMEYVAGEDLRWIWRRLRALERDMPIGVASRIIADGAAGLHYAHKARGPDGMPMSVVHRDVSPQNILIGFDGSVKLIDFGIAKAAGRLQSTNAGLLKGKYPYMSPEQVGGEAVDARSDQFSLGIIAYELLSRERLFRSDNDLVTLQLIRTCDIKPLDVLAPRVPAGLSMIVMKALSKAPEDRFASVGELRLALEEFIVSEHLQGSSAHLQAFMLEICAARIEAEAEMTRFGDVTPTTGMDLAYHRRPPVKTGDVPWPTPGPATQSSRLPSEASPTPSMSPPPATPTPVTGEDPELIIDVVSVTGTSSKRRGRRSMAVLFALLLVIGTGVGAGYLFVANDSVTGGTIEPRAVAVAEPVATQPPPSSTAASSLTPSLPSDPTFADSTRNPPQVTMQITSDPPGAMVSIDGKTLGPTPFDYSMAKEARPVAVFRLRGFEDRRETLSSSDGTEVKVKMRRRVVASRRPTKSSPELDIKTGR